MNRDLCYIVTFATLLVGCSDGVKTEDGQSTEDQTTEWGSIAISTSVEGTIADGVGVRSETSVYDIPSDLIPSDGDLAVVIESDGELYAKYDSLTAYNEAYIDGVDFSPPMLPEGDYTFILSSGEGEDVESATNACFWGSATLSVVARDYDKACSIDVAMSNSAIRISTTEAFDSYFAGGATLILSTEGGATIEYDITNKSEEVLYVSPATTLYLEGEGATQPATEDPTSTSSVTFQRSEIGVTTPSQMSSVVVDAEESGGSSIKISFDDTVNYIEYDTIELNPGSDN